jgi:uncharacterized protein involved in exopolysaccharide biosynthesis
MQGFVSDNIKDAEAKLNAASEVLESFMRESDPAALERERDLLLARQSAMHTDLADAAANREGARTRFTELQKQFEDQDLRSLTREEVEFRQPGVTLLRTEYQDLLAQMAALSVDLTEDHPRRKELQARIDRTGELIAEAVAEDFYSRIKTEETNPRLIESMAQIADAVAAEAMAGARIAALEALQQQDAARLQQLNGELAAAENGRMELGRQFQAAESYYLSLKQRSLEIDALANNPEGEFDLRVIDPAHNPDGDEMSLPKWGLVFPFAFLAAILFSLMIAFFLEYWRNAYRSSWEFEAETGAEVIVTVPRITRMKT